MSTHEGHRILFAIISLTLTPAPTISLTLTLAPTIGNAKAGPVPRQEIDYSAVDA